MKKLLKILAIGLILAPITGKAFAAPEKQKPTVILMEVTKSNGGYWSAINLYDEINYTVENFDAANNVIYAKLSCDGDGFSFCRAPRRAACNAATSTATDNLINSEAIAQMVNKLIEASEQEFQTGKLSGSKTNKSIIVVSGKSKLYFGTASWQYDQNGNGKISIRISEDPTGIASRL
ncbi:MAG: hypothetical protein J5862_04325 [Bacteroidales bacterium]|nr:hypothetical protein [Bacteroidales bacterium]